MRKTIGAALAVSVAAILLALASCAPGGRENGGTSMDTTKATTAAAVAETNAQTPVDALLDRVTINEQSSIRIETDRTIYIDPFRLKDAPHDADIIFITHAHYDHFSPEDIQKIRKDDTVFVCPETMLDDVAGLDVTREYIVPLMPGGTADIAGLPVETVPAYNINKQFHPKENGWLGYLLTVDGVRVYIAGDTDATDEAKAVKCDIAFLPIGGKYTMDAKEARALALTLSPAAAVPTHYGTVVGKASDYDTFAAGLDIAVKKLMF